MIANFCTHNVVHGCDDDLYYLFYFQNEHIKEIMGVKEKPDTINIIERKRLQWYGHVKRMQDERPPKLIMEWIPRERRKRGRPRKTWM